MKSGNFGWCRAIAMAAHLLSVACLLTKIDAMVTPASNSALTKRQTTGFSLAPEGKYEGMGLTSTCEQVLYQQINCDPVVAELAAKVYHGPIGDKAFTDSVCSTSCSTALTMARRRVAGACASTPEIVSGYPVLSLIDAVQTGWNETCQKDSQTGNYCNDIIRTFEPVDELSEMPKEELCSYCYGAKLRLMQSSPYSAYDEMYAERLKYVNENCEGSSSPTDPVLSPIDLNSTQPQNCEAVRKYTIQDGDTCDSMALQYSVSAATLYYVNPRLSNCTAPSAGLEICLPPQCETTYTLSSKEEDCVAIAVEQGTSWQNLVTWNAGINSRCTNIWSTNPFWGRVICVSAPGGEFVPPPPSNETGTSPGNGGSGGEGGSGDGYSNVIVDPPADGTVADGTTLRCGQFVQAEEGRGCNGILVRSAVPMNLFLEVNPSLGTATECSGNLVVGSWYCLHPYRYWNSMSSATSALTSSPLEASSTSPTAVLKARQAAGLLHSRQDGPVDPGVPEDCTFYDTAYSADQDCAYFESSWGITHGDFVSWNPSVLEDCSGLEVGHSYCVEVNYGIPPPTTSTRTTTGASSTATPMGPSPTQPGVAKDCNRWHKVEGRDTCSGLVSKYGSFTLTQFYQWNPEVGNNCQFLWLDYWYCIAVPGSGSISTPTTTTKTSTTTAPQTSTCGVGAPTPTQPGAACNCTRWHMVGDGDSCSAIYNEYHVTAKQFLAWNPNVGASCTTLWLGYYVCVRAHA